MKLLTFTLLSSIAAANASNTAAPRIIGGQEAPDGKYPYMVSLRLPGPPWMVLHNCGGSVLNKRWILTAAHCVSNRGNDSLQVVTGTNLIISGEGQVYKSEYLVAHKNWNTSRMYSNDIGLIRVSEDIEFNDKVQPVRLPQKDFYQVGYPVTISGWGTPQYGGPNPRKLQEITVKIADQDVCRKAFEKFRIIIAKSQICTFIKYGQGSCHGDSGSPLVADGVQIGIASFVHPCAVGDPDVFTRVYPFLDWIAAQQSKF